ncbi:VOC family protein [Corynebacterium rouxii]|uniref:VOC family protein n=1 Tax=Corynebacterium rouxii TaxID=2719119 RepID=A0ABU3PPT1_9CORY|nr:VOC family protein [Corynebacterium rouxii]MDT9409587.1 VOC family protein [Corynebacterium rouxii]MDT9411820.1 VOC family protein [Corynebacterium rouxii]
MRTTQLSRVGVVVYDLDATQREYERIYGITQWREQEVHTQDAVSYGRRTVETPGVWKSAVGTVYPEGNNGTPITFEIIQPISGESPFHEHLRTKREGICFVQICAQGKVDVRKHFEDLGISRIYSVTVDGQHRDFYDTRSHLGGFLVEMIVGEPTRVGFPDGQGEGFLPVDGVHHFGVIVHNVLESVEWYRAIFGIERFECKTWESGEGRLDNSQYRGESVKHGYFTAQGKAEDFAFEIIECSHGPSHYNREFFDIRGPGIHHIFAWMSTDQQEYDDVVHAMTDAGHPICMGSPLRGHAAEFSYVDTFNSLGGYLIELVVRRSTPNPAYGPDWIIDFKELV